MAFGVAELRAEGRLKSAAGPEVHIKVAKKGWLARKILVTPADPEKFLSRATAGGVAQIAKFNDQQQDEIRPRN